MKSVVIGLNKYFVLKFILVYLTITLLTTFYANAQLGSGCYVGGILYTTETERGPRFFYRTPDFVSDCGFVRTGSNLAICRLYNGGPINNINSYTSYPNSFSNDWREINCPIDSEVWLLLLVVSGFSIFRLKSITFG